MREHFEHVERRTLPTYRLKGLLLKIRYPPALLILALSMSSSTVSGQVPTPEIKKMCSSQMRSRCLKPWQSTPAGIMKCVDKNREKFSPVCQGFLDTAKTCQAEMMVVCGGFNPFKIKSCLANSGPKIF
jgi:hypothetical protein